MDLLTSSGPEAPLGKLVPDTEYNYTYLKALKKSKLPMLLKIIEQDKNPFTYLLNTSLPQTEHEFYEDILTKIYGRGKYGRWIDDDYEERRKKGKGRVPRKKLKSNSPSRKKLKGGKRYGARLTFLDHINSQQMENIFLRWIKNVEKQGWFDKIIDDILARKPLDKVFNPMKGKNMERYYNVKIKALKKSKIPAIEKALREDKDPMKIIEKVEDKHLRQFYERYVREMA